MVTIVERHNTEKQFWNNQTSKDSNRTFILNNNYAYPEMFSHIKKFSSLPSYLGDVKDKKILELGCGNGWVSLYFGRSKAIVKCVDISEVNIENAKRYVTANNLQDFVEPKVMAAEKIEYPDKYFDIVFMNAALHHCDVLAVRDEVLRVLKDGGKAIFVEDNGPHPLMWIYRLFSKHKHTQFEKALSANDINEVLKPFKKSKLEFYYLFNVFETTHSLLAKILDAIDNRLLLCFPCLKKYSKIVSIFVEK